MVACVHPMDGHRKLFAMMQAYLDESGIDHKTDFCILAGYVGGPGQWKRFERKWKGILARHNVKEFHAKRFFQRDDSGQRLDEYQNWTDDKADSFIRELLACIISVKIYPLSCSLVKRALECAHLRREALPYWRCFRYWQVHQFGRCKQGLLCAVSILHLYGDRVLWTRPEGAFCF